MQKGAHGIFITCEVTGLILHTPPHNYYSIHNYAIANAFFFNLEHQSLKRVLLCKIT